MLTTQDEKIPGKVLVYQDRGFYILEYSKEDEQITIRIPKSDNKLFDFQRVKKELDNIGLVPEFETHESAVHWRLSEEERQTLSTLIMACTCPRQCDCENPPPTGWDGKEGVYRISNHCPIHNDNPYPDPNCPVHG